MPSIRIILVRIFPKVLGTIRSTSGGYAISGSSSRIERVKIGNSNASSGNDQGQDDDIEMIIHPTTREADSVEDSPLGGSKGTHDRSKQIVIPHSAYGNFSRDESAVPKDFLHY